MGAVFRDELGEREGLLDVLAATHVCLHRVDLFGAVAVVVVIRGAHHQQLVVGAEPRRQRPHARIQVDEDVEVRGDQQRGGLPGQGLVDSGKGAPSNKGFAGRGESEDRGHWQDTLRCQLERGPAAKGMARNADLVGAAPRQGAGRVAGGLGQPAEHSHQVRRPPLDGLPVRLAPAVEIGLWWDVHRRVADVLGRGHHEPVRRQVHHQERGLRIDPCALTLAPSLARTPTCGRGRRQRSRLPPSTFSGGAPALTSIAVREEHERVLSGPRWRVLKRAIGHAKQRRGLGTPFHRRRRVPMPTVPRCGD